MLDDDPELEEAMAALPLEQLERDFRKQQQTVPQLPFASPAVARNVTPYSSSGARMPAPAPQHAGQLPAPPVPLPRPLPPPAPALAAHAVSLSAACDQTLSALPTSSFPLPVPPLPLPALLAEWHEVLAECRRGSPSLLNDPYELCFAIATQLEDGIDDPTTPATRAADNSSRPVRAPTEAQKQLYSVYAELMALLELPSSPFEDISLSSLRSPPHCEPALLHQLACIAYNTALRSDDWSLAAYMAHFALQLFALPAVPLPANVPSCLASLSLYLIALLDELAAREKPDVHAAYGEAMLRVLRAKRSREGMGKASSSGDNGLTDMLDLQARMYITSGRFYWADEEKKKQRAEQESSKKRKRKSLRKLAQPQWFDEARQSDSADLQQRLIALLAPRTLPVNKCEQLLAVAFQLQLDELKRPLVEHIIDRCPARSPVEWLLHYLALLCMLSSDDDLFVFASSALSSSSFPPMPFRCWQYLCERCWTAGIVRVRGGASELGERLLALGVRLLERACQCDASERSGCQLDEQQVLMQLKEVLAYVRERDKKQPPQATVT